MSSDLGLWLFLVVWVGGLVLASTQIPKLWAHREYVPIWDSVPGWWLWGGALWRGMVRVMPLAIAGCALLAVAVLYILLTGGPRDPRERVTEVDSVAAVLGLLLFLLFALMGSIMLVNRPRLLVPPHLHSQPGAITEWRVAVRRWAARMEGRPTVLKPLLFMLFMLTGQTVGAPRARGRGSDDRPGS